MTVKYYTCDKKSLLQRVKQASFVGTITKVTKVYNMFGMSKNVPDFDFSGKPDKKLEEYILSFPRKTKFSIKVETEDFAKDIVRILVIDVI